jgi:hypothetical protein
MIGDARSVAGRNSFSLIIFVARGLARSISGDAPVNRRVVGSFLVHAAPRLRLGASMCESYLRSQISDQSNELQASEFSDPRVVTPFVT